MAGIKTERIWTIAEDSLSPRRGRIRVESRREFINHSDVLGPIYVAGGLKPSDMAVFLQFTADRKTQELPEEPVGYLVTHVDEDGSGILVSGTHFETNPEDWINKRLEDGWKMLIKEGYTPEDFGITGLYEFLLARA